MSELKLSWMKKGEDREWLSAVGVRESPGQSCVPRLAQPDLTLNERSMAFLRVLVLGQERTGGAKPVFVVECGGGQR